MSPNPTAPSRTRRRSAAVSAVLLGGVVLLAACGGDDVDPADAETGILTELPPDPAASPAESDDPLTGSEP